MPGKTDKRNPTFGQALIAGIAAGTAEIGSIGHPLWVVKTRMQLGDPRPYALKGMYHGIGGNIGSMMPLVALRLGTATAFQNTFFNQQTNSLYQPFVSGAAGGSITFFFGSPLEFSRTLQLNNQRERKTSEKLSSTVKNKIKRSGFTSLYRGAAATMMRDSIHTCGFFALAPYIRKEIAPHIKDDRLSLGISGPIAGAFTAFTSQPFDAIRIQQQMSSKEDNPKRISMKKATEEITSKKGWGGFFTGSGPRLVRVGVGVGILAAVNDEVQTLFVEAEKTEKSYNKPSR